MINPNPGGGLTVDTANSPCENSVKVCCKPKRKKANQKTKTKKPNKCGVWNQWGVKRGGVKVIVTNTLGGEVTSQPGEWPHTCVILHKDNLNLDLLGGASLIAPKTVVTAAHILK